LVVVLPTGNRDVPYYWLYRLFLQIIVNIVLLYVPRIAILLYCSASLYFYLIKFHFQRHIRLPACVHMYCINTFLETVLKNLRLHCAFLPAEWVQSLT
jgi:hypothetical protein